jgi:outer membrane protein assembly factor BamB
LPPAERGNLEWKRDFVADLRTPLPAFGFVSSPLVDSGAVYVQAGASAIKLDAATGATSWRALEDGGGMNGSAFSSPILAVLSGRAQLLVQGRESLSGLDPASGSVLWSRPIPAFRGMNILTPLPLGDGVFTSSYQNKSWRLRISERDGAWSSAEAWSSPVQAYMSSPILHEGHAYLHLQNQRFACLDMTTGRQLWISPPFGKYASLVRRGDRILALDAGGRLLLFRASPDAFELLSERKVAEAESWAHLAVAGADVLVRDLDGVSSWRWE